MSTQTDRLSPLDTLTGLTARPSRRLGETPSSPRKLDQHDV
jgi:hypothetical protein